VTPSPTPEPATAIPTKTITELGITDANIINAFSGATFKQEVDGSYSVSAISYEGETKVQTKYFIDKSTFNAGLDIKDELTRPHEVDAYKLDAQGTKINVKLLWQGAERGWHEEYDMSKSDDPTLTKIDQHIFLADGEEIPLLQSARAYFRNQPQFSDAVIKRFMQNGGNSLLFQDTNRGKVVFLKSKGDDTRFTMDQATLKFSTLWVWQKINGVRQDIPLIVILDPADPKNPHKDEFKILLGVEDIGTNIGPDLTKLDSKQLANIASTFTDPKNPAVPKLILFGDQQFQDANPLLASLLALPDNDPRALNIKNYDNVGTIIERNLVALDKQVKVNSKDNLREIIISGKEAPYNLPPEIQLMRLFFQLGSWQP
jgi:hypothetical protein